MSKKLILFLMVLLFGSANFMRAEVVEIGDGTGTTYEVPFNSLYGYSFTEQVFLASEIGTAGTINSISFNLGQTYTTAQTNHYTVWMKNVARETFASNTDYEPVTAADVVFDGEWEIPANEVGWITLTLNTPFAYDGTSNLMFAMLEDTPSYSTRYFLYTSVENSGISYYSDSYVPDPYNLDSYSGSKVVRSKRTNVQINITTTPPPTPPTPTGDLTVTPNPFVMGIRPLNAWVEPYGVKITNGGAPATITATITTTTPAFELSEEIEDVTLGTDESLDFTVDINTEVDPGDYVGEFTMFYAQSGKSLIQIPVTATLYNATTPDVVEFPGNIALSYESGYATFEDTPDQAALHANYMLPEMEAPVKDAVYTMNLTKDSDVVIQTGTTNAYVALYNKVPNFHLTADVEPVYMTKTGSIDSIPVLAGEYYVVIASDYFETLHVSVAQRPVPTGIENIAPANFTTGVTGSSINLVWQGGEYATQYQVLFGTSPTNLAVYQDWTMIDENYGNFPVSGLVANTQYFWQIKVKNSNGAQTGTRWGFTTALTTPNMVTASAEEIFTDGSTLIKWKFSGGGGGGVLPETQIGSGTATNSYLPSYSLYNYSLTQQIYTVDEIGGAGIINSISFYNSGSTKTRSYTMYLVNTDKVAFSGATDWITATADDQVFTGTVTMTANAWTTLELTEPFAYTGDNLAIIMDDNTGTWESGMSCYVFDATGNQAIRVYSDGTNYDPLAPSSYSGTTMTVKNQIIINKESKGVAQDRSFQGFNIYYGDVKVNTALITEKQYLLENLPYNLTPGHNVAVTAVYDEGESELSSPVVVKVSGYATITGTVTELISGDPIAGVTVKLFGADEFGNNVNYETTTNNSGVYTVTVKAGSYNNGMAMLEGMETAYSPDMTASSPLVVAYEGIGNANFVMHEAYNPVASVYAEELNENLASIDWTLDPDATRGVSEYYIYRKPILTEEGEDFDSVQLYVAPATAHQYADFGWADQEPGLYLYGVSAHYPTLRGNRDEELTVHDGTATNGYVPVYGFYADAYLKCEMVYPAEELAEMTAGTINSMKFYATQASASWGAANFQVFMTEVADPSISAFVGPTDATVVYEGQLSISNSEMEVLFTTPYNYNGGNLLVGFYNTVTGSYVTSTWNGEAVTGASVQGYSYTSLESVSPTQRNFLPKTTFAYLPGGGGGGVADDPFTPVTWSNILPKDMENMVTVNITTPAGSVEGATVEFVNTFNEEITFNAVADETGVVEFPEFYKGNYEMTVLLEGFDSPVVGDVKEIWSDTTFNVMLTETYKPVDMVSVACTGFASWTDMMPAPERYVERYMIKLDNVYLDEVMENFYQIDTALLEVDQQYTVSVAVVYSTGMSTFVNGSFIYKGCEGVDQQVEGLAVDTAASTGWNVALVWNGGTPGPGPGPTPPTPPTGDTYDFDDGTFQGWTAIDANNDGYNWVLGSQIGGVYLVSGASLAGTGHNSSADMVCSGSFSNATSQAITPDNYLVSPAKAEYTGITFYACAQDASYAAEHFGVAVSTNGNTSGSDFAMVQEWTMTAKDAGAMSIGRDGQTRAQGNWYEKTVDLSAYAGQEIWVAIRHFNCNDQFILNVDDITLGVPEKRETATAETCGKFVAPTLTREPWDLITTFTAAEGGQYGVVTDGEFIYTSNWGYSSAAHNFYKYDMEGNMIEGFDIPGCGTLRGMTFDGEYIYGVANAATIYCVDLKNHTLIGQTTSGYGAMRCISYDPERDGFWVVGNWSGNLTLIDRTGATVFTGPTPSSASDVAYYKDGDGVEHVFCFNNADNGVYDYNVTTNTMGGQVFNFSQCPGFNSGSSGGCHVANYGDKVAFFGDIQQSPNLIGIYELREAGGGTVVEGLTPNKFNIMVDGEIVAATKDNYFVWTLEENDYTEHEYTVFYVDANFGISCPQTVSYAKQPESVKENQIVNAIYPNPTSGDLHINATAMTHISIINAMGQVMFEQDVNADETVVDMAKFESGVYMVSIITENGTSVKRVTVTK